MKHKFVGRWTFIKQIVYRLSLLLVGDWIKEIYAWKNKNLVQVRYYYRFLKKMRKIGITELLNGN